jgi:hypothetical protein
MNHDNHASHNTNFFFGINFGEMILPFLKNEDNYFIYFGILFAVFVLSIFLEFLVFLQHKKMTYKNNITRIIFYLIKTTSFTLHLSTGYIVMLALMSYNFGIFLSIILGHVVGFCIFSLRNSIE